MRQWFLLLTVLGPPLVVLLFSCAVSPPPRRNPVPKHSKGCICLACCAARLAKGKAPDPNQGDLLRAVREDSTRSSFRESSLDPPEPSSPIYREEGQERKREALTAHDQRRRLTLIWLRKQLYILYQERWGGEHGEGWERNPYVTADDVTRLLRANPDKDPGGPGSWKGAIFRGPEWRWTGELIPSVIAENNGRGQRAWRYVGP